MLRCAETAHRFTLTPGLICGMDTMVASVPLKAQRTSVEFEVIFLPPKKQGRNIYDALCDAYQASELHSSSIPEHEYIR